MSKLEMSSDSKVEHPANILSIFPAEAVLSPERSAEVIAVQPLNMPLRFPGSAGVPLSLTPGSMTTEVIFAACVSQGGVSFIIPSVPLSPLVGRMVSLPEPSMTQEQVPGRCQRPVR